jgi:DMSO/TMAO reductase YedYZ molybdopterin-dependent catalytic subunit
LIVRVLVLNCLTRFYGDLWNENWNEGYSNTRWGKKDNRLKNEFWHNLKKNWDFKYGLRNDYARRQALLEIDVLVAKKMKLTIEELLTIYRVQFPVLKNYEAETWYDRTGRIVFTVSKGLPNVGLPRKGISNDKSFQILNLNGKSEKAVPLGWEDVRNLPSGTIIRRTIQDDTQPGGLKERVIEYVAPFDRCNREADYREAWENLK